jgi:serine/threonine protein kinase
VSSSPYRQEAGSAFGGWRLISPLGAGGNGEVWRATRDGQETAIKLLHAIDVDRFARFRNEVRVLQMLGEHPGIVPILDSGLPDQPTVADPAWFVMPLATPLADHLGPTPSLEAAVGAVASIAETLDRLWVSHRISHRDLKPNNLYFYNRAWALGDFGLAHDPGREPITAEDVRWLGARNFIAPEMVHQPSSASGGAADVYSLAKTLRALAAHETYPPADLTITPDGQGRLPAVLRDHDRWLFIAILLEFCTEVEPLKRPPMGQMADELAAWLKRDVGQRPWSTLTLSGEFNVALGEHRGLDSPEARQILRGLFLLDRADHLRSLNTRQQEDGTYWVDVTPWLHIAFEPAGNTKKRVLAYYRTGHDPRATTKELLG